MATVPYFAGILSEKLRRLAARSVVRRLHRGEILIETGHGPELAWLVSSGLILRSVFAADGRSLTVDLRRPAEGFCSSGDGDQTPIQTSALIDSVVVGVPLGPALDAIAGRPDLLRRFTGDLTARLRESQSMRVIVIESAARRVLRVLKWLQEKLGPRIPFTRKAIADVAGLPRETVIRALSPIEKKGWIRSKRGQLRIIRPDKIARMLDAGGRHDHR